MKTKAPAADEAEKTPIPSMSREETFRRKRELNQQKKAYEEMMEKRVASMILSGFDRQTIMEKTGVTGPQYSRYRERWLSDGGLNATDVEYNRRLSVKRMESLWQELLVIIRARPTGKETPEVLASLPTVSDRIRAIGTAATVQERIDVLVHADPRLKQLDGTDEDKARAAVLAFISRLPPASRDHLIISMRGEMAAQKFLKPIAPESSESGGEAGEVAVAGEGGDVDG